jgi:iron complex outermembrane receptor protein
VPLFNENNVNNFQKIYKRLTYIHMFRLVRFPSSFMKILSVRTPALPACFSADRCGPAARRDEQTMVVTAAPTAVSELDTPAAVSVVNGDEMRQAAPRVNL